MVSNTSGETHSPPKTPIEPRRLRESNVPALHPVTRSTATGYTNGNSSIEEPQKSSETQSASQRSVQDVPVSFDTSNFPDIAVQISQRENLDKDEYLTYHSSSSANQGSLPSSTPNSELRFKEPSSLNSNHSIYHPSSSSEQTSSQVESSIQDWTQTQDRVSTDNSAGTAEREGGHTIPDSQPQQRSPVRTSSSKTASPQTKDAFGGTPFQKTLPARVLDLQQGNSSPSYNNSSTRRRRHLTISELTTQSSTVVGDNSQQNNHYVPRYIHSESSATPIQIPASAGKPDWRGHSAEQSNSDNNLVPQTQETNTIESVQSTEGVANGSAPSHTLQPPVINIMDSQEQAEASRASAFPSTASQPEQGSGSSESFVDKIARKQREAQASTAASLDAERQKRQQSQVPPIPEPSPRIKTNLEIQTGLTNIPRSPKRPLSPPLFRTVLSPKGPKSPSGLRSPLEVRLSTPNMGQSPRSVGSPSHIPEKLPYQPQEEPSYISVEPSEMVKDVPVPIQRSRPSTQSQMHGGPTSSQSTLSSVPMTTIDIQNLGAMEFVVPLSLPPRTQKQYIETYKYSIDHIRKFLAGSPDPQLLDDLNVLLDRVGKVTTHLDLDGGGPSSQDQVNVEEEASYAESCSEKFKVLGEILERTRQDIIHIVIFARNGQLLDFIESYLKAKRVNYTRPDSLARSNSEDNFGRSHISLLASRDDGSSSSSWPADIVIAFDETFDPNDARVKSFRTRASDVGRLSPVIRLLVYASLEHINLCLPTTLEPVDRLRRLTYCMLLTEKIVGQLPSDGLSPSFDLSFCGHNIATFIRRDGLASDWPIPKIPPLENIPVMDSDSTLSEAMSDVSEEYKPEGPLRYWPNPVPPKISTFEVKTSGKRPYVSSPIVFSLLDEHEQPGLGI